MFIITKTQSIEDGGATLFALHSEGLVPVF